MFYVVRGVTNFTADAREFTSVSYLFTRAASRGRIWGANTKRLQALCDRCTFSILSFLLLGSFICASFYSTYSTEDKNQSFLHPFKYTTRVRSSRDLIYIQTHKQIVG